MASLLGGGGSVITPPINNSITPDPNTTSLTGTTAAAPQAPSATDPNQSAKDILQDELDSWGLSGLVQQAWGLITSGATADQVVAQLRQTDDYKQRFAGMAARAQKGLPAISEAQYLNLEDTYAQVAHQYGLLPGTYDPAQAIGNDVSATEFSNRASLASAAIYSEPPEVQQALLNYYQLNTGNTASYYLNPDNALPKLQSMLRTGEIGGSASQLGLNFSQATAEQIAQAYGGSDAYTSAAVRAALTKAASDRQSTGGIGQATLGDDTLGQAEFGLNTAASLAVQQQQKDRVSSFQGGGQGAYTAEGLLSSKTAV